MSFFLRRFIFIKHTKKQGGYIMREHKNGDKISGFVRDVLSGRQELGGRADGAC